MYVKLQKRKHEKKINFPYIKDIVKYIFTISS